MVDATLHTSKEEQRHLWEKAAHRQQASALAHPNIAFIKYWGNEDNDLRLPANPSLSMNLGSLYTKTTVTFDEKLPDDKLAINHQAASGTRPAPGQPGERCLI